MRLGTRWHYGAAPPSSIPDDLRAEITRVESERPEAEGMSWTLTWLEGQPVITLDDGTRIGDESSVETEVDSNW